LVLESILSAPSAYNHPYRIVGLSILYVCTAVALNVVIPSLQGAAIVFAMVPFIPMFWKMVQHDEQNDNHGLNALPVNSLAYHGHIVNALVYMFLGATIAYSVCFVVLPPVYSSSLFSSQVQEIGLINPSAVASPGTGDFANSGLAWQLFSHNLVVLGAMFLLCLVYGVGAIYLLLWNASILGVFLGTIYQRQGLAGMALGVLGITPHGFLEIGAYIIATLAGMILAAALANHHHKHPNFKYIAADVALLTVVALLMLALGAILEASY
jgi:uncharacterized membrane protein SpoIIM required for sporulation